jgi:predicted Zn-dependent protease
LREAVKLAPDLGEAHYSLGLLLAENEEELEEAAEHLARAAEAAPDNPRMQYNLGLARQRLGDMRGAEEALTAAYKLQPESLDFLNALAQLYIAERHWSKAIACAEEMVRRNPQLPELQQFLAQIKAEASRKPPVGPSPR